MSDPLLQQRYVFRDLMVERLTQDLEGPTKSDEILVEPPLNRYIAGVLWPQVNSADAEVVLEDTQSEAVSTDKGPPDSPVAGARRSAPSSAGLTFSVLAKTDCVTFRASAARYERANWNGSLAGDPRLVIDNPETPDGESDPHGAFKHQWTRVSEEFPPISVSLLSSDGKPQTLQLSPAGLELYVIVRPADSDGIRTVTAVLRNVRTWTPGQSRDEASWFQVSLQATTSVPAITDRSKLHMVGSSDADLRSSQLLFRNNFSFGAGHGCAVTWDSSQVEEGSISSIRITFIPRAEVPRSQPDGPDIDLSLELFSSADLETLTSQLEKLCDAYEAWIDDRAAGLTANIGDDAVGDDRLRKTGFEHLEAASDALTRMRNGIKLLLNDPLALQAFQLANQAMHHQRARQDWIRAGAQGEFALGNQAWRPFQIAFVLINIPSITDRNSLEREIADLLWFPAGGGKTEAYLALIAYLIIIRRLRDPLVEGTAVIMRYTLRLLTVQQFERAAMLVCSLEFLRRGSKGILGERPFGVGLWVGGGSTPNSIKDAKRSLVELQSGGEVEDGNPVQLKACPWCGTRLRHSDYLVNAKATELTIRCSRLGCEFHNGLPAYVVDEDVYRVRPELVIGTVDKFAAMAWNGSVATLFGRVETRDIGPDLIIQDELHLISGPLGSTVGLYETAVDLAAGRVSPEGKFQRPKIVASTATIRRASGQVRTVFDRESKLFPPPGLNPDESFFARPANRNELGTREYVGVMAPGTSHATLMVRCYASVLNSALEAGTATEIRDAYWTLIGYFNSLRVLGSAYLQVQDDVSSRLKLLAGRHRATGERLVTVEELTSREPNSKITETLKQLETGLFSLDVDSQTARPLDVVLATNMISVGLDVDRLGLMAVMGQPPSSSEYIQATSRVGRKFPGLVLTIFNSAKSRDRSHYEGFTDFHHSLYRAVEATSATPFADRSRDRALHASLVSALRMTIPRLRPNESAASFDPQDPGVRHVEQAFLNRCQRVADQHTWSATKLDLARLLDEWAKGVGQSTDLRAYENIKDASRSLLIDATQALTDPLKLSLSRTDVPWSTPRSMRDVDAETRLYPANMKSTTKDYTDGQGD